MPIIQVEEQAVTVELSAEDARVLALALSVASSDAFSFKDRMTHAGLPEPGSPRAAKWGRKRGS